MTKKEAMTMAAELAVALGAKRGKGFTGHRWLMVPGSCLIAYVTGGDHGLRYVDRHNDGEDVCSVRLMKGDGRMKTFQETVIGESIRFDRQSIVEAIWAKAGAQHELRTPDRWPYRPMTEAEAKVKAVETAALNEGREFQAVPVRYGSGETGWDVSPVDLDERVAAALRAEHERSLSKRWPE